MNLLLPLHTLSRLANALLASALVTFGLLLLMQFLIDNKLEEPTVIKEIIIADVFYKEEKIIDIIEEVEEEIVEPPATELTIEPIVLSDIDTEFSKESFSTDTAITETDQINMDSDTPIRLVAVAPIYPERARQLEIEGYVDIQFDIGANGTTSNFQILTAYPSSIFNRAVKRAVSRWRYTPKMVNGKPVAVKGVMERVSFKLEK